MSSPPLDDAAATSLVRSMDQRSGPLAELRDWKVERSWRSFTADFSLLRSGEHQVALKLGRNWTGHEATYVAEECGRVGEVCSRLSAGRVEVPEVFGVSESPPALALAYVEGVLLMDAVRSLDTPTAERLIESCGQAIGAFHDAQPATDETESVDRARSEFIAGARRAGLSRDRAGRLAASLPRARGYRFSPNDFLIDDSGTIVLLDPPHVSKYDYVHRDLASFIMELHRAVVGGRRPGPDDDLERLAVLGEAFLRGYTTTGPIDAVDSSDQAAIRIFQISRISGVAMGRLKAGRVGAALTSARWAWWLRRGLEDGQNRASDQVQ